MLRSGAALRRSGFWHVTVDLMLSWLFHGSSNQKEEEGTNEKKKAGTKGNLSAACPPRDISILTAPPIHSHHDGRCYVFCLLTSSMGTERDPLHAFILAPRGRGRDRLGQHGRLRTKQWPRPCCAVGAGVFLPVRLAFVGGALAGIEKSGRCDVRAPSLSIPALGPTDCGCLESMQACEGG